MTKLVEILLSRNAGLVRVALVSGCNGSAQKALSRMGLVSDVDLLVECTREDAVDILQAVLWKDMAYEDELMPADTARDHAQCFLEAYSDLGSRYFSNGNLAKREGWNPLTESVFDAGIIVQRADGVSVGLWAEDED